MEESRDVLSRQVQQLGLVVADLQRRLEALEERSGAPLRIESAPPPARLAAPAAAGDDVALVDAGSLVPLFGWAFVGLAGAYLLRAMTESGAIPGLLGAGLGIVYAAWWLFLAARRAKDRPMFSTVHAVTAALILAPMLWETTVRFRLLSAPAASAVLVLFAVLGLAIGWRQNIHPVAWVATLAGLLTVTALFRETHDGRAWAATILAIALAVEFSACRDHWLGLRWVVAIAADLAVLALTLIATMAGASAGVIASPWFVLAAQMALLLIYLSSTVDRTLFRGLPITWFEVGQAAAAFIISVGGALRLAEATSIAGGTVGLFCLAGGIACYVVSFALLEHQTGRNRNFFTYSTFALLLTTVACWLVFSNVRVAAWSVLAVAMMCAGLWGGRTTLRVHAFVYLIFGALGANLIAIATARVIVTGEPRAAMNLPAPYWFALAGIGLCYAAMLLMGGRRSGHWSDHVETAAFAALLVWGFAGAAAAWMYAYIAANPSLRTGLLTALAALAAWAGARWGRRELGWLAYPLLAAAGLKIVFEDFAAGRSLVLFVSLVLFGGTLILLPRLLRPRGPRTALPLPAAPVVGRVDRGSDNLRPDCQSGL